MSLPADATDDLIYDARIGDLSALQTDLSTLSTQLNLPTSQIIASAIDAEPQEEGGTGCCLLHFPAANGNFGTPSSPLSPTSHFLPTYYIYQGIR